MEVFGWQREAHECGCIFEQTNSNLDCGNDKPKRIQKKVKNNKSEHDMSKCYNSSINLVGKQFNYVLLVEIEEVVKSDQTTHHELINCACLFVHNYVAVPQSAHYLSNSLLLLYHKFARNHNLYPNSMLSEMQGAFMLS